MTGPPRVLIAGAGIAGLALRHALAGRGVDADVVEHDIRPRTGGTGLYLPANAVRALRDLDLSDALDEHAVPIARQEIRDQRGRLLTGFDLDAIWGEIGWCRAIRRADLHAVLLQAAGRSGIRFGTALKEASDDGEVTFGDGTYERYDLVAGADGMDSAARRTAFPSSVPHFLGQICWRFLAPEGALPSGTWTARLASQGRTFLTLPVGGGEVYCFAAIDSRTGVEPAADWRSLFTDFAPPVDELLAAARIVNFAPLHEVRGDDWTRPNVVLLGDAAHAGSPSMAQGCAMALEDALVLAELLAQACDRKAVPAMLRAYRARRAGRIRFVLEQNHRRDRARTLPGVVRALLFRTFGRQLIRANHAQLLSRP